MCSVREARSSSVRSRSASCASSSSRCSRRCREEERADALAGAAALAEPLFDPERLNAETGADSSLATLHGLYWLSANLAARRPLLLAIDDLHWCDLPSLRWLAYLLPRMEGLALSVLVGLRPAEAGEDPACSTRSCPTRSRP